MTSSFGAFGDGPGRIAISRTIPRGTPAGFRRMIKLAPSGELLGASKKGGLPWVEYATRYRAEVLAPLDPLVVARELRAMYPLGPEPTLLCWCAPGANCHRRLVAEWLRGAGERIAEWVMPRFAVVVQHVAGPNTPADDAWDALELPEGWSSEPIGSDLSERITVPARHAEHARELVAADISMCGIAATIAAVEVVR